MGKQVQNATEDISEIVSPEECGNLKSPQEKIVYFSAAL